MKLIQHLMRLSLLALLVVLSSCAHYDKRYQQLAATADTNPAKDAIVGMWHRKHESSSPLMDAHWHSELFKADGTGTKTFYMPDPILGLMNTDKVHQSTWRPSGDGTWQVDYREGYRAECRISQGKLLQKSGRMHFVLDRVAP